jgi:DoxX-like family
MFVATAMVTVLLAALLAWSAVRKLSHEEQVVRTYVRAGVPEDKLNHLAIILLLGATGLVAGLAWAPLGVAAAIGVLCYFALAVASHIRARDAGNLRTPLTLAAIAAIALALRLATA